MKRKPESTPYYQDIVEALDKAGCPICRLLAASTERYLDSVLWELVNDHGVRDELNRARGYCQQHGWLLVRAGAALGVAILMRDVVRTLLAEVETNPIEEVSESAVQGLLRSLERDPECKATVKLEAALAPQTPCPVCALEQDRECDYVKTLTAHLVGRGALADAYRASDGLCLEHFRGALARASSKSEAEMLVAVQQAVWQRLHEELGEFIRKNDHQFRGETFGQEKDSWRRALEAVSGPAPRSQSARQGLT